jgi:heme exporter protein D
MREFLEMGGYAAFIWPAYGVTALVLTVLVLDSVTRLKRRLAELARLEGTDE